MQLSLLLNIGLPEILGIAFIVLLLFGAKKIPELMRGLGKGLGEFKKGVKDIESEISDTEDKKP
jgi:sec-independent protein translocase protein TatA